RQGLFPNPQQRERESIDPDIIVFIETARLFQFPRLAFSAAKFFDAYERMRLAEHLAFPFAGLLRVMMAGDFCVMRRIVSAVLYIQSYRIIDIFDQAAIDSQPQHCRNKTFCHAVGRFRREGRAELCDDVPVTNDNPIGSTPLFRQWTKWTTEDFYLI